MSSEFLTIRNSAQPYSTCARHGTQWPSDSCCSCCCVWYYTHVGVISPKQSSDPALPWSKLISSILTLKKWFVQKRAFELAPVVLLSGWQSQGGPAGCQACVSELGELSSGHGSSETSHLYVISNGKSSPRDLHLNAKTQLHSMTRKLNCWTPYAKELARQEHNAIH